MKTKILKYLFRVLSPHPTAKDLLTIRFITEDGVRYYGYKQKPPPERYIRIQRLYNLFVVGVSEEGYDQAIKGVIHSLKGGVENAQKKSKNKQLQKAFALLFELEHRGGEPSYDAILQSLALSLVREDEDPLGFSPTTHEEKKVALNEMLEVNPERLIHLPEYKLFYDSGISGELLKQIQENNGLTNNQINAILAS